MTAATLLIIGFFVSMGLATYGLNKADQHQDQAAENAALKAALVDISTDVTVLRQQLKRLEDAEKSVRLVFGFPEIDPTVRALGTGGSVAPAEPPQNETDRMIYAIETEVAGLLRRSEFERENYESVMRSLMGRKNQLDHTPSIYPINGRLARGYGYKADPFTNQIRMHTGLDLAAPIGTPIFAPAAGTVILCERQSHYGNFIAINHGYGIETCYGHLSRFAVKPHDVVRRGDIIGYVGSSGYSTGPHVHYEVVLNGRPVDPMGYIYDRAPQADVSSASGEKKKS
ncbi:MAG: M23 family metallopeptidase [Candidatus Zixiibacteriota bacterium]